MMYLALAIFALISGVFIMGYVTTKLWNWFIAPLGVKKITFWHGLGIALFAASLMSNQLGTKPPQRTLEESAILVVSMVVAAGVTLLMGAFAKSRLEHQAYLAPTYEPQKRRNTEIDNDTF